MGTPDTSRSSRLSWLLVAFIVPALIVFSVYTYLSESKLPDAKYSAITIRTEEFDRSFLLRGVDKDLHDLSYIKTSLGSSDKINSTAATRTLLTEHMSVVFLLGLLLGPSIASELFKAFFYFRFGLAGAAFFHLANDNLKVKEDPALLLGTVYSLSSIVLFSASLNTSMMNMVILLPIAVSSLDKLNRIRSIKRGFMSVVICSFLALSGAPGLICGIPFCLVCGVFLLLSDKDIDALKFIKGIARILIVTLTGILCASVAVCPILKNLTSHAELNDVFENGKIRFFLIDFIYKLLDGNISGIPSDSSSPVMGIYVFTVMLLILFFANGQIPLRTKTYTGIVMLLTYISVSYSPADMILSFGNPSSALLYSRLACLLFLIMLAATLSLRNVREVTTGAVYLGAFLLLGLIVVESSAASEVSISIVSKFLSAGCVIFWAAVFVYMVNGYKELPSSAITAAIIGIAFNVLFCMGPSYSARDDILHSFVGESSEEIVSVFDADEGAVPLFGDDNDTYLVLSSDTAIQISGENYCDTINTVMRGALLDEIFLQLPSDNMFTQDMLDMGGGRYTVSPDAPRNEATIRVYLNDLSAPYYVVSSFNCNSYVTESYGERDRTNQFSGPFMLRLDPSVSEAYIKISLSHPSDLTGDFKVYFLDQSRCERLRSSLGTIENSRIDLTGEPLLQASGAKTVVTSVPYSSNIEVTYTDHGKKIHADTFEICGKLAFSFENDGFVNYVMDIGCDSGDVKLGGVFTAMTVCGVIFIYLMYNNKTARHINKETYLAEQKD